MSFAYYRLPYGEKYTIVRSATADRILPAYENIGLSEGFVVAPFVNTKTTPIVLISPDDVEEKPVPDIMKGNTSRCRNCSERRHVTDAYSNAFDNFHEAIVRGEFMKLVLSRTDEKNIPDVDVEELFFEACRRYPRVMVMLVSTSATGTWLVATPEILMTGDGTSWRTMALAGTMPYEEGYQQWNEKNQQEQHFVETYIEDCLSDFSTKIVKDGPRTQRAGNIVHLCTDFHFHLADGCSIGYVLASLHPTPAVCGMPKIKARDFIIANENVARGYYSGFMGPVGIGGMTSLYVVLRCACIKGNKAVLYAGGGIMPDSRLQSEWEETEHKMQTIGDLINNIT